MGSVVIGAAAPRALIAEDDADLVVLMTCFLRDHGYDVVAATDGAVARSHLFTTPFDVAIVDIGIPYVSGLELLREARRAQPDLPVVVISGSAEHQVEAFELGAEAFLIKPVRPEVVLAALERAMRFARLLVSERAARGRAEQALRASQQLLAVVSHDLRTPLNVLGLSLSLLGREATAANEGVRRRVQLAQRAVVNMQNLVEGLLDQSTLEQGRLRLRRARADAGALAREFAETLLQLAEDRGIDVETSIPDAPLQVVCDRERVMRVLANLGANAVKHTPRGGRVRVAVDAVPGGVRFSVTDTGPGIPPEARPHLFQPYWQERPGAEGVGLGLYIARGLVEAHGGRIGCDCPPEGGATFAFVLPAQAARTRRGEEASARAG